MIRKPEGKPSIVAAMRVRDSPAVIHLSMLQCPTRPTADARLLTG